MRWSLVLPLNSLVLKLILKLWKRSWPSACSIYGRERRTRRLLSSCVSLSGGSLGHSCDSKPRSWGVARYHRIVRVEIRHKNTQLQTRSTKKWYVLFSTFWWSGCVTAVKMDGLLDFFYHFINIIFIFFMSRDAIAVGYNHCFTFAFILKHTLHTSWYLFLGYCWTLFLRQIS